nr:ADP-ribosylation factor-like protein 5B [Mirounga angustirostris]
MFMVCFLFVEHKVIIVGLDNAGKTTILYQFLMNEVVHTSPTIGSNVEEIVVKNTHFLMWDIGGQESLRSSWNTYYSNTEFIILVVDSIDRERLAITKEELYRMLAHEVNFESKLKPWSKVSVYYCFFTKIMGFAVGYFIINRILYFD